ncbi:hypothetical protein BKA61DRAFT_598006 [Leptodontidium sp. MPI-SDFR-AT-0119]|nr:hypothetical protein BKA61DRAFT_598006 [Leptodontidium sp. MPI-SDFR-AT-0119]
MLSNRHVSLDLLWCGPSTRDWQIGVPAHLFVYASSLLLSPPHANTYITAPPYAIQPKSLMHTYPRYKCDGLNLFFQILPSSDFHFDCEPPNFVRSSNSLPYPKLGVFIQSLIDTHDRVALCDVVDGTDITEKWGLENLDLSGTNDVDWAKKKNDTIRAHLGSWNVFYLIPTTAVSRRDTWEEIVQGKEARLGFKHPKELFATRFRLRASEDPWLIHRDGA